MVDQKDKKSPNAWIAIDHGGGNDPTLADFILSLKGPRSLYPGVIDEDWVLVLNAGNDITRVGRVLRTRSNLDATTLYLDRLLLVDPNVSIGVTSLSPRLLAVSYESNG